MGDRRKIAFLEGSGEWVAVLEFAEISNKEFGKGRGEN